MRRPPTSARRACAAAGSVRRGRLAFEHAGVGSERRDEGRWCRAARRGIAGAEARLPRVAVEPTGAVARHAVAHLGRDAVGEDAEHGRVGEGRVQEVHGAQIGPSFGQHPAQQRKVVVLHEHGVALAGAAGDDVGDGAVVGPVPLPGHPPVAVEAGPLRQVEEVVVHVPQRGVGHDVVGLAVGLVVDEDGHQVQAVVVHEALGDGLAVRRPHRHRGPRRAAARQQPRAMTRRGRRRQGRARGCRRRESGS